MADDTPAGPAGDGDADPRFIDDLLARGQAAEVDADGNLPEGATHELIVDDEGHRRVVRRRFFGLSDE